MPALQQHDPWQGQHACVTGAFHSVKSEHRYFFATIEVCRVTAQICNCRLLQYPLDGNVHFRTVIGLRVQLYFQYNLRLLDYLRMAVEEVYFALLDR